jgi:hypothetical protein
MVKLSDIPQLTATAQYHINVHLVRFRQYFEDLDKDYGLILDPDYQRDYVWTEAQQIAFVEYILKGGRTSDILFNSPGWGKPGYEGAPIEIVDGKQRLNALFLFVDNKIKAFGYLWSEFDVSVGRVINVDIRINGLSTRKELLKWYLELNSGGTVHTVEELDKVKKLMELENLN